VIILMPRYFYPVSKELHVGGGGGATKCNDKNRVVNYGNPTIHVHFRLFSY